MRAEISITVDVADAEALRTAAGSDYCLRNAGRAEAFDEAEDFFGAAGAARTGECLRHFFDRSPPADAGVTIVDSCATVHDDLPVLREIRMVTAGTGQLTKEELQRINGAFGMLPAGPTYMALEDITHDGLWMSPKNNGFYVRVPCSERINEVLPELTAEMRTLVDAALRQNATRIEFDADEETAEGFEEFDHG